MNGIPESAKAEFFSECEEIIQRVSSQLSAFDKNDASHESIDSLYRDIHTLKGSAQLFGYKNLGGVAHAIEAVLDPIRSGREVVSPDLLQQLWVTLDVLEEMIKSLKGDPSLKDGSLETSLQTVTALLESAAINFRSAYAPLKDQAFFLLMIDLLRRERIQHLGIPILTQIP